MKVSVLTLCFSLLVGFSLSGQEYRSYDGYGNNLSHPEWGSSGVMVESLVSNGYADQVSAIGGVDRPNPRAISNYLFSQDGLINNRMNLSDYVWVFGQFVDHDIIISDNNVAEPILIPVPAGDPMFDPFNTGNVVIPIFRSEYHHETGTGPDNPRRHINGITAFLDASAVYGSDSYRATWLRTFTDGKLKVSAGNLLPFNTTDGEFNSPRDPLAPFMGDDTHSGNKLFVAGDVRANENPLLIAFHTLFVREHNRLCDLLKEEHPDWSDEELYQHARSYVIGLFQSIVYDEWLTAMGVHIEPYSGYKPNVNPGIFNVFATAAFRLGHTLLTSEIIRMNNAGEVIPQGNLTLREAFFRPREVILAGGLDPYFKGMGTQLHQDLDCKVIDDVRNFLFGPPGAGGLDLAAINIMRGRERGLPDFNTVREDIGLPRVESCGEFCTNPTLSQDLEMLYPSVDNIDPWVGMLAEDHMPDALFGKTIMRIMKLQFTNIRDGDRFYYENDPELTPEEVEEIKATRLSDVIMRNTNITLMQKDVFEAMDHDKIPFTQISVGTRPMDVSFFPNPIDNMLNMKLFADYDGEVEIRAFNTMAQEIFASSMFVEEGENTISIPIGRGLAPGTYFLRIAMGDAENTIRFIKQ